MKRFPAALAFTIVVTAGASGHTQQSAEQMPTDLKETPAYGVLVRQKMAVEAELANLSAMFASRHPDVRSKRFELNLIRLEIEKMQTVEKIGLPKLSDVSGNLILRKVTLKVELHNLLGRFKARHPDVEKKMLELAALERELENILQ